MKSGIEIWLEADRATALRQALQSLTGSKFIDLGDEMLNTTEIEGIFTAPTLADFTRRKNGEWKCTHNEWHTRGQQCDCSQANRYKIEQKKFDEKYGEA